MADEEKGAMALKLAEWLASDDSEDGVEVVTNSSTKMKMILGLLMTFNFGRATRMTTFIEEAEEVIFDPARVRTMDLEELVELYKMATGGVTSIVEGVRKYLAQNKEAGDKEQTIDKINSQLMNLPRHRLKELLDYIEKMGVVKEEPIDLDKS